MYAVYLKLFTYLEIMNEMRQQLKQVESELKRAKKGRQSEESKREVHRTGVIKGEISKIESIIEESMMKNPQIVLAMQIPVPPSETPVVIAA